MITVVHSSVGDYIDMLTRLPITPISRLKSRLVGFIKRAFLPLYDPSRDGIILNDNEGANSSGPVFNDNGFVFATESVTKRFWDGLRKSKLRPLLLGGCLQRNWLRLSKAV